MTISYIIDDSLYLNITNRCPNKCEFCVRTQGDGIADSQSLWLESEPTIVQIIEDLAHRDFSRYGEIVFCGFGEPLTRLDDTVKICKWIREHSAIPIRINTNGLSDLIHEKETAPMLEGLVDALSISLNAATPERYNEICKPVFGLESHTAILKFAAQATQYVPSVTLSVVDVIPEDEIEACRILAEKAGVRFRVRKFIDKD